MTRETVTEITCDRCKKTKEGEDDWVSLEYKTRDHRQSGAHFDLAMDLCPTCRKAFKLFLHGGRA